ncbi:cyclohexanecarboxylate-CoA ligase/acyl-CoA synthetase [Rhizobiales bacterium GAS188]|nr:cyclohexanecarboxylate-CoA ligase/acyl-CoA synthetase [Rhizobiales bacterium GAS188]
MRAPKSQGSFAPGADPSWESVWGEEVLRDWIERWASEAPDRAAIRLGDERITYAELHRRASSLAAVLHELGLRRGDVIAAQLPNGVEFISTYLAAGYVGATLQTLHMPYRSAEIEPLLRHGGAKAVICLARMKDFAPAETMLSLRSHLPSLSHIISVGDRVDGAVSFPASTDRPMPAVPRAAASDRFLLLYTSGTSAAPKGVPVPYRKYLANARLSASELGIGASSTLLTAAPFTHLYGLFTLNLAFAVGATTAILPGFTPEALASALDICRPTALFVAPAHMAACLNAGLLTVERLASLAMVQISGSVCPQDLARAVQDRLPHGEVHQLWGMSELQAGAFTRPGDALELRLSSAGRASPATELRVADDGASGGEGELQVKGASVFDAYLDDGAASAEAFTADGWFRSGDLARIDAHGHIRITGRVKELINRGGVKFNPVDIEAAIARHPDVASCAIVPMPDPVLGERACCFLVPREAARRPSLGDVCAHLANQGIAKTRWPEHLEIIDEMPMTPTRKVKKGELAQRAAALRGSWRAS